MEPGPVPVAADAIVIQPQADVAFHWQSDRVVTVTTPVPPSAPILALVGDSVNEQGSGDGSVGPSLPHATASPVRVTNRARANCLQRDMACLPAIQSNSEAMAAAGSRA
jgi:hypothetical protein